MLDDREEVEHIPWSELAATAQDDRRPHLYAIAGLAGAVVLGILVARTWWSTPDVTVAPGPITNEAPTAMEGSVADGTSELPLYSEADLVAGPLDSRTRIAVTRAEWFVTDYFTVDVDPSGSADVTTPSSAGDIPGFPQDRPGAIAYVEWASAFSVEELAEGRFRVGVLFRSVGAPPDGRFQRLPVRAVELLVEVAPDGGTSILEIPQPTERPASLAFPEFPDETDDVPLDVRESATAQVRAWGPEPRFEIGFRYEDHWRVFVTVADEVGNRFPLAVLVPIG